MRKQCSDSDIGNSQRERKRERLWESPPSALCPPPLTLHIYASGQRFKEEDCSTCLLIKGVFLCRYFTAKNLCNNLSVFLVHMFFFHQRTFIRGEKREKERKKEKNISSTESSAAPGSRINTFNRRVLLVPVSGQTVVWVWKLAWALMVVFLPCNAK